MRARIKSGPAGRFPSSIEGAWRLALRLAARTDICRKKPALFRPPRYRTPRVRGSDQ